MACFNSTLLENFAAILAGVLVALKNVGVAGVVVGKALYEGRFTLKEAIKTVKEN